MLTKGSAATYAERMPPQTARGSSDSSTTPHVSWATTSPPAAPAPIFSNPLPRSSSTSANTSPSTTAAPIGAAVPPTTAPPSMRSTPAPTSPPTASTLCKPLRYHVGNLLRERADAEALAASGLSPVSPKERLNRNRDIVSALAAGSTPDLIRDHLRVISYAEALLDNVPAETLAALRGKERVAARLALEAVCDRAHDLLPLVSTPAERRRKGM